MSALNKTIICIYLSAEDSRLLPNFFGSPYGQMLRNDKDIEFFEVYASPHFQCSFQDNRKINLATPENYSQLSLKTYEMFRYFCSQFEFSRLIKIDVTCVSSDLVDSRYQGRSPIDPAPIVNLISSAPPYVDYIGTQWHANPQREDIEAWARAKGGSVHLSKVFGENNIMPRWFSGKCYSVSRRFADYISCEGFSMAQEHAQYLMGSEDMMIGRLYQSFSQSR